MITCWHGLIWVFFPLIPAGTDKLEDRHWLPLAEQAVNVVYKLAERPDTLCGNILKKVAGVVLSYERAAGVTTPQPSEPSGSQPEGSQGEGQLRG